MFDHGSRLDPAVRLAETRPRRGPAGRDRQLEEQVAALQARQLLADRGAGRVVSGAGVRSRGPVLDARRRPLVAMQVAAARRISLAAAERYIVDAEQLVVDLPEVVGVLEAGLTSLEAVRAVAHEAVNVAARARRRSSTQMVADDLLDVPITSQARTAARRRAFELNPDAAQIGRRGGSAGAVRHRPPHRRRRDRRA